MAGEPATARGLAPWPIRQTEGPFCHLAAPVDPRSLGRASRDLTEIASLSAVKAVARCQAPELDSATPPAAPSDPARGLCSGVEGHGIGLAIATLGGTTR